MKTILTALLTLLAVTRLSAQDFQGNNVPGTGTNFTVTVPAGVSNLCLTVTNNTAAAYSQLLLSYGPVVADTTNDFVSLLAGVTNSIYLELPECRATNYSLRVRTPASSAAHAFRVTLATNVTGLRTSLPPAKAPGLAVAGVLTNQQWHYYRVELPTNTPGWRLILNSTNLANPADLYVRRGELPTPGNFDERMVASSNAMVLLTEAQTVMGAWYIGVRQPAGVNEYRLYAGTGYLASVVWDPGLTHLGTQVYTNSNTNGGTYYFRVTTANTSVGAWRTALNVDAGEADVFLRQGSWAENPASYNFSSTRTGADGLVLHSSQFAAGQDWFIAVNASPGARWRLVTGEAYVLPLGTLAPFNSAASSTNVTVGAEGWRFFRTSVPANTLAWRLWLNGAGNDIFVRSNAVPLGPTRAWYDLRQPRQMLVVPTYLMGGSQYYIGVAGAPGAPVDLDSRQQEIIDRPFASSTPLNLTGYGYVTYRIQVPVQQIAWLASVLPAAGNPNLAVRRDLVANEWNNNGFSEVGGLVTDSVALVPSTDQSVGTGGALSDGTFFVTVYGVANYSGTLESGNPVITDVNYVSTTVNNDPSRVGWRYYRVPNIAQQLGTLGWDLFLTSQPPGTELAIRRNAVPGRWNYRRNASYDEPGFQNQPYVDFSGPGFLQRPGHQADIWYVGAYNPGTALGNFVLNLRDLGGVTVPFNATVTNIVNQTPNRFQYLRVDVPAGALGWDLRITNVLSGDPRLIVRRDLLPDSKSTHAHPGNGGWNWQASVSWPSGYQIAASSDWTALSSSPTGASEDYRILAMGRGNPLEPGTYYVGVINGDVNDLTPMSYTLVSRGIGPGYAIPVAPLAFTGGSATINALPAREAMYYQIDVPTNSSTWALRFTTNSGDALIVLQKDFLPNVLAVGSVPWTTSGGRRMNKAGDEQFLALPATLDGRLVAGRYYCLVAGVGNLPSSGSRVGPGVSAGVLTSVGELAPVDLGVAAGADLVQSGALAGGAVQTYRFTVPPGVLGLEVWLENRTGNPRMALRPDDLVPMPQDSYGFSGGASPSWAAADLINLANPVATNYTLTVQATYTGPGSSAFAVYSNATYTVRVRRLTATPLAFDGGSITVASGHRGDNWRYFTVTVPSNALGWDLRLTNAVSGQPRLSVRRSIAPDNLTTHSPGGGGWNPRADGQWLPGYQWAPEVDWTGGAIDASGTNRSGQVFQAGLGNPVSPGDYVIGVFAGDSRTNELRYTLASRGIGPGYTVPVTPLAFAGGTAIISNLAPREAAYYVVHVPTNLASWRLRLATNVGEALFLIQKDALPGIEGGGTRPQIPGNGRKVQKRGNEHYLSLPEAGDTNIAAGTYYLLVASQGDTPETASPLGAGPFAGRLETHGPLVPVNLGSIPAGDIVHSASLEGGQIQAFQFSVPPGTLSMEVRLENRVGNPRMTARPGSDLVGVGDSYGNNGGSLAEFQNNSLFLVANPTNSLWTVMVQAAYTGPSSGITSTYSNASFTLRVHAVGTAPLTFDGGVVSITNQPADSWQYFYVTVPPGALGWDLRLTDITGGVPRMVARRESLPNNANSAAPNGGGWNYYLDTQWRTNFQWGAAEDWTGYTQLASGANASYQVIQCGMGNPLSPGNYYIGVIGDSGSGPLTYTLRSRGIGSGFTIPVTPLAFNGGVVTNAGLPVREAAYYSVVVPTNVTSWKTRLAVGAGDTTLLVQKDYLPGSSPGGSAISPSHGRRLKKVGNEQYVLFPQSGATNLAAGTYYLLVASEGRFPTATRYGTNTSSYQLESQGMLPVIHLGTLAGADLVDTNLLEGGELRGYTFSIPTNLPAIEVRLDNRSGNPVHTLRTGSLWPASAEGYGASFGQSITWTDSDLTTIAQPAATNYSAIVVGRVVGQNFPDAGYTFRVRRSTVTDLAFDPSMAGCGGGGLSAQNCTNATVCGFLADDERAFYRVQVPAALPDGTPVLGWELRFSSNAVGNAQLRVRRNLFPDDTVGSCNSGQSAFFTAGAIFVPPFLTPGTWFVEVRGQGPSGYCLVSSAVRLQRPPWVMPALGQPVATPGLVGGPLFGDSGVTTNGTALPGDGGTDLEQGLYHHYAISVPANNGGLLRVVIEAISGNPDVYLRSLRVPSPDHDHNGGSCLTPVVERQLVGNGTEYGNFVPNEGRYEAALTNGTWYLAVRATGGSNCRYRIRLATGQVTDLALNGSVTNQTIAAGDWRFYRFQVPSNAPVDWQVSFNQIVGDVVMYVRDTIPPGQFSSISDYRHWASGNDSKNHGLPPVYSYPTSFDPAGTYTFPVGPIRPGTVYYIGFRAVSDATFALTSATNAVTIGDLPVIPFYGGFVTNFMAPGARLRYRIFVPGDATRWVSRALHGSAVRWWLDQGSLPTETSADHATSAGVANAGINQYLLTPRNYPWMPGTVWYLTVSNTAAVSSPFAWFMDGRNCGNDDSDNDGLPDCWELTYFPSIGTYTGAQDPDGDGNSNLVEYQDGTDPTDPTSMLARLNLTVVGPGSVNVSPLQAAYPWGTVVTLAAVPVPPNVMNGWTGPGIAGMANPLFLTMSTNRTLTATFGPDYGVHGQTRADYRFQSNLVSSVGTPPDLTFTGPGPFFTNQLVDGAPRVTLRWPAGRGLQLQPTVPVFPSNSYTLVTLCRLDTVASWRRIFDSKNAVGDQGLYVLSGRLILYPASVQSANVCMTNDTWHQVALTRDFAGMVSVYCDGVLQFTYNDAATGYTVVSGPNSMRFFKDDGSEESAGSVCRIRTWADALSPAEITALDRCPAISDPIVFLDPAVTADNRFRFTLTGPPGPLYRVQVSSNLVDWLTVTNLPGFPGTWRYTNATIFTAPEYRFYRALIP